MFGYVDDAREGQTASDEAIRPEAAMQNGGHGLMGGNGIMGGSGLYSVVGALLVVLLIVAIVRMAQRK